MGIAAPTQSTVRNYVNGKWQASTAAEHRDIINHATNEVIGQVPLSSAAEVDAAVQAAARAFPEWRRTPPEDLTQYLFKLKNLLEDHFDELARTIILKNGKTLDAAKGAQRRAITNVEVACGIP